MASLWLLYASLFVLGLGLHVALPVVLMLLVDRRTAQAIGRKYLRLWLVAVHKPVLTVNTSSELTCKRRSYDEELDVEKVSFGGLLSSITRRLRDPRDRLHRFYGVRFGFVEEYSGLVFDPRDADVGRVAYEHMEAGSLKRVGEPEGERLPIYIRAVFELPEGVRGVDLRDVWHLLGGSANAQYVDWLIEMYAESQDPRSDQLSFAQLMAPVASLVGMLILGAIVANMSTGGGGGGGGGGGVGIGGILLLLAAPAAYWKPVYRTYLVLGVGALGLSGLVYVLLGLLPLTLVLKLAGALGAGMLVLPAVAWFLGKSLGPLGVALGQLYAIVGFFGFKDPVITLGADDEYRVVDASETNLQTDPSWYRFAKTWVGVAYENRQDVWPGRESALDDLDLEPYIEDDVDPPDVLPPGTAPAMSRGGHRGFVPKKSQLRPDTVYLKSGHALSWFREVGRGRLLVRALKNAKEEHFGGTNDNETFVRNMVIGFALLGLIVDWFVFF